MGLGCRVPPAPGFGGRGGGCAPHPAPHPAPLSAPQRFWVRSLGWVEMSEEELSPGRSSVAIPPPQLPVPPPQGRALLLLLEGRTLELVDPQDQTLLHAQPVAAIRVWGVGRDSGR
uniref:Uncharacterized protein n=1 Tax=Calidris pygmaea TaxID=425635 RepID=A0A8C3J1Y7_9CHAR